MPFTPFHLGPGLLIKAVAPHRFSFLAYAVSQVIIDVESGYFLFTGQQPVHRTLHTFAVGGLVGAGAGLVAAKIAQRIAPDLSKSSDPRVQSEASLSAGLAGGLTGGLIHSLLDGIMHRDIQPFRPFISGNPLLELVGTQTLHWGCLLTGIVGLFWLVWPSADKRGYLKS